MRFGIGKAPSFKHRTGTGLPRAHIAAARRRYAAMLRDAADILPRLPQPGESLHALMTGLYDFMSVVGLVITSRPASCRSLRIATLAFSSRNVHEILELVGRGAVQNVLLVCSDFFAKHNPAIFAEARSKLGEIGAKLAAPRCHAKVCCLEFEDGVKLVFEGSANLRTNKNIEQFCLVNDPELHDWHATWIEGKAGEYAKATKAETMKRVEEVFQLLLGGAELHDIRQYASSSVDEDGKPREPWNVSDRQLQRYVANANQLCKERIDAKADHLLSRHLLQRRRLYAHAMEVGDYKAALAVLKDEAELERLYEAHDLPGPPCEPDAGAAAMGTGDVVKVLAARLRQIDAADLPTAEKSRLTATLADALLRAIGVDVLDKRLEALQAVLLDRKDKGR